MADLSPHPIAPDSAADGPAVVRVLDKHGNPIRRRWRAVGCLCENGRRRLCTVEGLAEHATQFAQMARRNHPGFDIFEVLPA